MRRGHRDEESGHRLRRRLRILKDDAQRWPFELLVNVLLASPLVPRIVRAGVLRAIGMQIECHDIYPRCTFRSTKLKIGKGTVINFGCYFDNDALVQIGDRVGVGMHVTFLTVGHQLGPSDQRVDACQMKPIIVGDGSWIGTNAVILPGVRIGAGCVIGAGSVVRTDCLPNTMYGGVPARPIGQLDLALGARIANN